MIAKRQGELMGSIQSKAMVKVYATLTPEQREKQSTARALPQRFGKRG